MIIMAGINIFQIYKEQRYTMLLIMLLLLLLTGPIISMAFFKDHVMARELIWSISFSSVLLFGYFAVSHHPRTTRIALTLCSLAILTQALKVLFPINIILMGNYTFGMAFMLFNIIIIFHVIFTSRVVTANILSASLCLYLLFAVIWSQAFSLLELIEPGSFISQFETDQEFLLGRSITPFYFSLVTMTTLGYGDIVPVTQAARMLSAVEALLGQLYMAVLVARLVALQLIHSKRNEE